VAHRRIGAGIIVFSSCLSSSTSLSHVLRRAALVPVSVCLAYIFALRQGKPPGYDRDCFEYLMTGRASVPKFTVPAPIHFYES